MLDGYEILEHVLEKLFSEREKRVKAITRQIIKRRKPRSHIGKRGR